jgi:hypothetical protein
MNSATVSIVILNYNGYKDTLECLESIFQMHYQDFMVVIVDNGSNNDSIEQIKLWLAANKADSTKIHIIATGENLGFARGNNVGINYVLENNRSKYVLVLNNDTIVEPDFILSLLEMFNNDKVALVGPKIIEANKSLHFQGYFANRLNIFNYIAFLTPLRDIFVKTPLSVEFKIKKSDLPQKVYSLPGCCLLFNAAIFNKIGLFDEKTFLGWEECIIAEKLYRAGYATYVNPKSRIFHKVSKDTAAISWSTRKKTYLDSEKYFQENYLNMPKYQTSIIDSVRYLTSFLSRLRKGRA